MISRQFERPLSGKADIKPETPEIESEDVRFTLRSGHSAKIRLFSAVLMTAIGKSGHYNTVSTTLKKVADIRRS